MSIWLADITAPSAAAPTAWQVRCKAALETAGGKAGRVTLKTWADSTLGAQPLVVFDIDVKDKHMTAVAGRQYPAATSRWYHSVGYAVRTGVRHFGWVAGDDAFIKTMSAALDRCIADGDEEKK